MATKAKDDEYDYLFKGALVADINPHLGVDFAKVISGRGHVVTILLCLN